MTDKATPAAEGQLNKSENSAVQVEHESTLIYFQPDSEELVFLAESAGGEFDQHWSELLLCVDTIHQADEQYQSLIEKYRLIYAQSAKAEQAAKAAEEAEKAQNKLDDAKKALSKHIGDFASSNGDYKSVVELIPIKETSQRDGRARAGSRYVYVKKSYYDKLGEKKHNVKLSSDDLSSASKSVYVNGRIDVKKLRDQLTAVKFPKPKKDDVKIPGPADLVNIDKTLLEWAGSWNDFLGQDANGKTRSVDVSAGAQFLRFTSNVGMSGKWDPNNGEVNYAAKGSAVIHLASGTVNANYYYPDRIGWTLKYEITSKETIDMGMLRVFLNADLVGFVGASVQAGVQLQVTTCMSEKGLKQVLSGQKSDELSHFSTRRTTGAKFQKKMEKNDKGINIDAEAFGGARAEAVLKGAMQWLEPTSSLEQRNASKEDKIAAAQYVDFCTIGSSIAGLAGIGAGAAFQCDFVNGKFCLKVAASLCFGAGAKGAFICEVGYKHFKNFSTWLIYQLYTLNYHYLEIIVPDAFEAFTQFCVLEMAGLKENFYKFSEDTAMEVTALGYEFLNYIQEISNDSMNIMAATKKRNKLAENINTSSGFLLSYTPEAKGILLYSITRHGTVDHFDGDNYGPGMDLYAFRKEAVINILRSIQTRGEWWEVMRHRTRDGTPETTLSIPEVEQEVREYLNVSVSRENEFDVIYSRLKLEVSWGYALAMNDSQEYLLNTDVNPNYPNGRLFTPVSNRRTLTA